MANRLQISPATIWYGTESGRVVRYFSARRAAERWAAKCPHRRLRAEATELDVLGSDKHRFDNLDRKETQP